MAGQSVTLTLEDEIDISRGDLLVADAAPAQRGRSVRGDHGLDGRASRCCPGGRTCSSAARARCAPPSRRCSYKINVNTLREARRPASSSSTRSATWQLSLDQPLAFDPYEENRDTGGFILIDRISNNTVGAGMLHASLRAGAESALAGARRQQARPRAAHKNQSACVLWFTGLSGAGKSTIANLVEKQLFGVGRHTYLLDGDNVRHGLNRDLGFTDADRVENIRRVAEVARLMTDAGLIVLVSFISPFRAERRTGARAGRLRGSSSRSSSIPRSPRPRSATPRGSIARRAPGEIRNFTGIDSPYERPEQPELRIDTRVSTPEQAAEQIINYLRNAGMIDREWVFYP